ncbi:uncharacterized protein METZ01_LOCUS205830, partial [marine metagenome]
LNQLLVFCLLAEDHQFRVNVRDACYLHHSLDNQVLRGDRL